jgi:hypothetical protein
MTPQQGSLSGVIICPAYWMGQRLRVNSVTTTNPLLDTNNWQTVKGLRRLNDAGSRSARERISL